MCAKVASALCVGPKGWAQTSGPAHELGIRRPLRGPRTYGPPAGRARFLVARAPCRAHFSPISVPGPAWLCGGFRTRPGTQGRPDFVHWRPCSNGGLYTGCGLHCTNPRWNRPSSAQSPSRRFRAPRAAGSRPAGCLPTQRDTKGTVPFLSRKTRQEAIPPGASNVAMKRVDTSPAVPDIQKSRGPARGS